MTIEEPGQRLLFQNDRIRIWEEILTAGADPRLHRHAYQFIPIVVEGGTVEVYDENGEKSWNGDLPPGPMDWRAADDVPFIHGVRNVSDRDMKLVIVEDIVA